MKVLFKKRKDSLKIIDDLHCTYTRHVPSPTPLFSVIEYKGCGLAQVCLHVYTNRSLKS